MPGSQRLPTLPDGPIAVPSRLPGSMRLSSSVPLPKRLPAASCLLPSSVESLEFLSPGNSRFAHSIFEIQFCRLPAACCPLVPVSPFLRFPVSPVLRFRISSASRQLPLPAAALWQAGAASFCKSAPPSLLTTNLAHSRRLCYKEAGPRPPAARLPVACRPSF